MRHWIQSALDLFSASNSEAKTTLSPVSNSPNKALRPVKSRRTVELAPTLLDDSSLSSNWPSSPISPSSRHKKILWKLPVFEVNSLPHSLKASEPEPDFLSSLTSNDSKDFLVQHEPLSLFQHPSASHWITLNGAKTGPIAIAYCLERGQRKSIGFMIDEKGLRVKAPRQVGLFEIEQALHTKSHWILRKLYEMKEKSHRLLQQKVQWKVGAYIEYLGQSIELQLDPSHLSQAKTGQLVGSTLYLHLPYHATEQQIKDCAQSWLMAQANAFFTDRLQHFAPLLGVRWKQLKLSNANTRWGSAKTDGSIRLHWRLIHFKPSVIDYVVVHELAHLRVMNHSPAFWDTVEQVLPNYQVHQQDLKNVVLSPWT